MNKIKNNILYVVLAMILVYDISVYSMFHWGDSDFFHIAYAGKYICKNGIIYENPFFVETGYKTVVQQWLYSVAVHVVHEKYNDMGCAVFTAVQAIFVYIFTFILMTERKSSKKNALIFAFIPLITMNYINIRPQMISIILLLIELIGVERYIKAKSKVKKIIWLSILPLTTLLEINVHSTFWIFHFIFLLPYIFPYSIVPKKIRAKLKIKNKSIPFPVFSVVMTVMFAVMFINPYGMSGILCFFNAPDLSQSNIMEYTGMKVLSFQCMMLILTWLGYIYAYQKGKIDSVTTFFLIGTSILYVLLIRNSILFFFGVIYVLDALSKVIHFKKLEHINEVISKSKFINTNAFYVLFIFGGILVYLVANTTHELKISNSDVLDSSVCPKYALSYINENENEISDIKMLTTFDNGAYFLYNGIGHVYYDAKSEPYSDKINGKKNIVNEYNFITTYADKETLNKFFDEYDFDYICLDFRQMSVINYLLENENYAEVAVDENTTKVCKKYEVPISRLFKVVK